MNLMLCVAMMLSMNMQAIALTIDDISIPYQSKCVRSYDLALSKRQIKM